ncbi:MAG: response regulator transcription factor [Elusimicrobia bacterium]|nr:response regulator transcription factor [Elusimicrobiota bacterium]
MGQVLIVEDEPVTQKILVKAFQKWGYKTLAASTLAQAQRLLGQRKDIALVILDLMLPDGDGIKLCRKIKRNPQTRLLPVVVLTSLKRFRYAIHAYRNGADLHLTKPIDLAKLKQYAKAIVHRLPYRGERPHFLTYGALTFQPDENKVFVRGRAPLHLPVRLFGLLYLLALRQGKVVPRVVLVRRLWKNSVRDKEVDVAVSRLRRHLGPKLSRLVKTVSGQGYALAHDLT